MSTNIIQTKATLVKKEKKKSIINSTSSKFNDEQNRQLEWVTKTLGSDKFNDDIWESTIGIILKVAQDERSSDRSIETSYSSVNQICKRFLNNVPFKSLKLLLPAVQAFGKQSKSLNTSFSAINLLWNISDQIRVRLKHHGEPNVQQIWILLLGSLANLSVDVRYDVRKNACETLFQIIISHSDDLSPSSWHVMLSDILSSLVERIRVFTKHDSSPLIHFADLCLIFVIEFYSQLATIKENANNRVLITIIHGLSDPLVLRYQRATTANLINCISAFMSVCYVGLPIARQHPDNFKSIWLSFINIIDKFIFSQTRNSKKLNTQERRSLEFMDCKLILLIQKEILPFASILPLDFMQHVLDVLKKASILDFDNTFDLCKQRTDLCKASFGALLSLSKIQIRRQSSNKADTSDKDGKKMLHEHSLQVHSISALLLHCKQVINAYTRDAQSVIQLSPQRIQQVIYVLQAVSSLIERINGKSSKPINGSILDHLIDLYPNIVQMISSCRNNIEVQFAVMSTLKSYQSLMILNLHSHIISLTDNKK